MSGLKRRALHDDTPTTISQAKDEVDINNTYIRESANSYEEGTSSAGEQEEDETQEDPETPEAGDVFRRRSIPTPSPILNQKHHINEVQGGNGLYFALALAGVLVGSLLVYVGSNFIAEKQCAFKSLRGNKPQQPEQVWKALQMGIEGLINKRDKHPSVFLFLHQDPKLQKLIDAIAAEASVCFGGPSQLIHMNKEDFGSNMNDYGLAIERFKAKVKDGKVFLIVNLNEIAPSGARALHTICDTYSPIVEDTVIFLTLRTFNTTAAPNSVQLATDTLYDLWGKELGDNELDPLITRVTDQVLHLSGST
ncbi:uncharacterized protein LOC108038801 [Drosophila rhopaloa]|uniref:Uncharacterized protein LOC108038801 n=1 Tax=Drosophila rhopaloa TaxID=1041015 RepID=A0A6P4E3W4_DRORH|nr:uncharacterized protein LOC108038801 [Drosophila rhopaloa]